MATLREMQDALAKAASGGMTAADARAQRVCLFCKQPPRFYSDAGRREFQISGQCEFCFDEGCTEPEDLCATCDKPASFHEHRIGRGECRRFVPKEI